MKKMVVILYIVVLGIAFLVMPVAAQTEGCHGDILSFACGCNACSATALNLQVIPTCDGLQLTWNDIGADGYLIEVYDPTINLWFGINLIEGTSYTISNADLPRGTYSFAILPFDSELGFECFSNIVCDVEFPATCPNIPEFPSIVLPAAMIIGFLGAVLLIQRTREK